MILLSSYNSDLRARKATVTFWRFGNIHIINTYLHFLFLLLLQGCIKGVCSDIRYSEQSLIFWSYPDQIEKVFPNVRRDCSRCNYISKKKFSFEQYNLKLVIFRSNRINQIEKLTPHYTIKNFFSYKFISYDFSIEPSYQKLDFQVKNSTLYIILKSLLWFMCGTM